ncbi:hypothetical protein NG829_02785 [Xanthomonas sacchari]|uniref:hypothetical protein n=1 Tax=Xanthomonas sacchari TaxID=56458 RepID=UPI00225E00BA|nr:hypothetical protein [Xanthomonas sacchari]UYK81257.1 hypothetical protein NG829_02785 [Xanthomonas sacchari]
MSTALDHRHGSRATHMNTKTAFLALRTDGPGKWTAMSKFSILGCLALLVSCGRSDHKIEAPPVSGNGSCKTFDVESTRAKAESGDLSAIRGMRDYSLDCVLHDNGPETLRWGHLAAEKGGSQDKELYESLKMTFIPKK